MLQIILLFIAIFSLQSFIHIILEGTLSIQSYLWFYAIIDIFLLFIFNSNHFFSYFVKDDSLSKTTIILFDIFFILSFIYIFKRYGINTEIVIWFATLGLLISIKNYQLWN